MLFASRRVVLGSFLALAVCWGTDSRAAEVGQSTIVTVGEMCGGCVTKITTHFKEVKEIAELKCDIPTKSVKFVPKKGNELSALKIWEEMEKIGKAPLQLVGPTGTFTSKPKK